MKTLERQTLLPLDAIGALELGQKPEAVRIVRQQLGVDMPVAQALIEGYLKQHPVEIMPGFSADGSGHWLWLLLCGVALLSLGGLTLLS